MKLKSFAALFLTAICLCSVFSVTAFAETDTTFAVTRNISPAYEIANNATSILVIDGSTANCSSQVYGANIVSITVTQTLQKYLGLWIWTDVNDAKTSKTVNDSSLYLSTTKIGLSSGTYRVESVFTLTNKDGKTETITVYSDEKSVN